MNPSKDLHKHLSPGSEKLKVLHIGNIANNGYNIANLFNQAGMQSDLIIGPYYHIAGCPEWEDSEFEGDIGDQFFPAWHKVKITNGFSRPEWAAQGPWETCIGYLMHRNKGNKIRAKIFWWWLLLCQRSTAYDISNNTNLTTVLGSPKKVGLTISNAIKRIGIIITVLFKRLGLAIFNFIWRIKNALYLTKYYAILAKYHVVSGFYRSVRYMLLSNSITKPLFYKLREVRRSYIGYYDKKNLHQELSDATDVEESNILDVKDNIRDADDGAIDIKESELISHQALADQLKPLFDYYDVIVGYSTDGIWPLLVDKKYVAYEHGTIRTLPFEDSLQGEICKMVYQQAPEVIISNFDNNLAAQKLGLRRYTCIPHYINEMEVPIEHGAMIRQQYKTRHGSNFIIYNPSRQHWSEDADAGWEKGNDIFIRGFAKFVKDVNSDAMAIMTHWGTSLDQSKQLIAELGIDKNVDWIEPVPHKQMIQYIHASHIVSDQFLLGTFGGIPAKAFMHGRPVLSSFDPSIHEWCFKTMPPFLPARSEADIFNSLKKCYEDSAYYEKTANESITWYRQEHSNEVLLSRMSEVLLKSVS